MMLCGVVGRRREGEEGRREVCVCGVWVWVWVKEWEKGRGGGRGVRYSPNFKSR